MTSTKIAIVAALEREVHPLIRRWKKTEREHSERSYKFFESDSAVLVCSGIGQEAARRATEAVIALYNPELVQSVGFAGALRPTMRIGDIFMPARIIDAADGSSIETHDGEGTLITFGSIAGSAQKEKLAKAYGAQAVDMEAAAVALAAGRHNLPFRAVKVVSDAADFEFPEMDRFISQGNFKAASFVSYALVRPWLWKRVAQLAVNSRRAAKALCRELERSEHERPANLDSSPQMHLS